MNTRRNQIPQIAILVGSGLLIGTLLSVGGAMAFEAGDDPVPVQQVTDATTSTTETPASPSTSTATTQPAISTAAPTADPALGPVAPAPDGAPIEDVVANHEVRITDLEEQPAPTAPPAPTLPPTTAPPTTVYRPPVTTPGEQPPPLEP